jgi:uncharacterized protein YbaR (Trm112 family)
MPTSSNLVRPPLLEMLRCPEDRTRLRLADDKLLARLNDAASAGQLRNAAGSAISERLDGGLVREDGRVVYPIVEGIPRLLVDEGIPLAQLTT